MRYAKPNQRKPDPSRKLRYISESRSGISRRKHGMSFSYFQRGKRVKNKQTLLRIQRLTIPPAWTKVRISPFANSHLQATGRDAKGRKQYRYHDDFREDREELKFSNLVSFAHCLPLVRRRIKRDLNLRGLPRERVLAAIVELLEQTLVRIGNGEYARTNHSFGLSTLKNRHLHKSGNTLRFIFLGKSGVKHSVEIHDRKLTQIIRKCHDLPGQQLFEYRDHRGKVHAVNSADVNNYIRMSANGDFTAKNFRTWWGTVAAVRAFSKIDTSISRKSSKRLIAAVVKEVADHLRDTPAVCRKSYIHPAIIASVAKGTFHQALRRSQARCKPTSGFSNDEIVALSFLTRHSQ